MADLAEGRAAAAGGAERGSLKEVALFFLLLGTTAFGGPAAHIAIMEDEFVRGSLRGPIGEQGVHWTVGFDMSPIHVRGLHDGLRRAW